MTIEYDRQITPTSAGEKHVAERAARAMYSAKICRVIFEDLPTEVAVARYFGKFKLAEFIDRQPLPVYGPELNDNMGQWFHQMLLNFDAAWDQFDSTR